jgi:predicted GH43/DUF377 family glycosyl hydrolase
MSEPAPPRIRHNADLAAWFIVQNKITGRYPRVIDQLPCLALEHQKLFAYGYNPSILKIAEGILMAYRYHEGKTLHSDLALAALTQEGGVVHNKKINLGAGGEDPKLFTMAGMAHLSWVESNYPITPFKSVVRYGFLEENGPRIITPNIPGNDFSTLQKNWVFFEHDLDLYCIYQCHPQQVTYRLNGAEIAAEYRTPGPRWAYGHARGGTAPLQYEGNLIRFFHSGLDNEFGQYYRRYFMGAYLMRPDPPFEVLATSFKPILYGGEIDRLKKADRELCQQHKRQVVFPGGAINVDDGWLVSVGVNDSACEIVKVTPKDLHLI